MSLEIDLPTTPPSVLAYHLALANARRTSIFTGAGPSTAPQGSIVGATRGRGSNRGRKPLAGLVSRNTENQRAYRARLAQENAEDGDDEME